MDNGKLLAYMESLDRRVGNIEESVLVINRELGELVGKVKSTTVPMLIKFVVFPLIVIVGSLVGIRLFVPFV